MKNSKVNSIRSLFLSRLDTLAFLIEIGTTHFGDEPESILKKQLISDMLPFGTQVVFTCNQPHNFIRWCEGKVPENRDPYVKTLSQAKEIITDVKTQLNNISVNIEDAKLEENITVEIGGNLYLELTGVEYLEDFLIPNFYFHLVTAYDILRMSGVPIGKHEYMRHLGPKVKQREG